MILCCPHCGCNLREPVKDGLGSCSHCSRSFDSNPFHRILAACWYVRRNHVGDVEMLMHHGIDEAEAFIALALAFDADYSHDEILKILAKLGVSKDYVT